MREVAAGHIRYQLLSRVRELIWFSYAIRINNNLTRNLCGNFCWYKIVGKTSGGSSFLKLGSTWPYRKNYSRGGILGNSRVRDYTW